MKMALIVATSALLGGITVAVWNRGSLEGMRRSELSKSPETRETPAGEEEFI